MSSLFGIGNNEPTEKDQARIEREKLKELPDQTRTETS